MKATAVLLIVGLAASASAQTINITAIEDLLSGSQHRIHVMACMKCFIYNSDAFHVLSVERQTHRAVES